MALGALLLLSRATWAQVQEWPSHRDFVRRLRLCFLALAGMAVVMSKQFTQYHRLCQWTAGRRHSWEAGAQTALGRSPQTVDLVFCVPCNHPFT